MPLHISGTLIGIIKVFILALLSMLIADIPAIKSIGVSPLIIGILVGLVYSHTLSHITPEHWGHGVTFSTKRILRLAIILLGFNITIQSLLAAGIEGVIAALTAVIAILFIGIYLGKKIFKIDSTTTILISMGSAICGAAAVLAAKSIFNAEQYKTSVAIATVVIFGTLNMFLYPVLFYTGILDMSHHAYGIFTGATIHEVAQTVVAGNAISEEALNTAVTVKMMRVISLPFVLVAMSIVVSRQNKDSTGKAKITIPWFAFGFIVSILINSSHIISPEITALISKGTVVLFAMAMVALGMQTHISQIKKAGVKPLLLAGILNVLLIVGGVSLVHTLT